jgi:hypothetical protein
MNRYAYFFVLVILAIFALVAIYFIQIRRRQSGSKGHSWASYLFLWPHILDVDKTKRNGRFLSKREWIGWLVVGLLIAAGIFIGGPSLAP